ncbi:hypothetical protein [Dubosiella newyorkensis]|uniref:hypothetical protein n=2 Tax=Dubosiella newyorkensis TaxID=1862672 RepID=UPI00258A7836|nr:hypothetical protein [Dubosiella newyorkensis]
MKKSFRQICSQVSIGVFACSMIVNVPVFAEEEDPKESIKDAVEIEQDEIKEGTASPQKSAFSINSYSLVNEKGEPIETLKKGDVFTLIVTATDPNVSTEKALEQKEVDKINQSVHSLNIDRLTDDFSGGQDVQAILLSQKQEPLKVKILFKDVKWKGKGDAFRFQIGYAALDIQYTAHTIEIKECSEEVKEPENTGSDAEQPSDTIVDDNMSWSGGSSGGGFEGSSQTIKTAAPNLIVKKYSYGKDPIYAGKEFQLSLEFFNTSKTLACENIVVSLETGDGLSIANSSNTFYFESLGAQASKTIDLTMKALSIEKNMSAVIDVNFRYDYVADQERINQTMAEKISIPIYLKDRFEIQDPTLPEMASVGSECVVSFNYVNKGKSTLSNVEAKVEGDIPALQKVQNVGNIDPGTSGSIDVILTPDQPGIQKATILLSYENANEELVEKKFPIELNVEDMAPMTPDDSMGEIPDEEKSSPWGWVLGLIALLGAGAVIVFLKKRHKKKQQKEDHEDLDFDDEDLKE